MHVHIELAYEYGLFKLGKWDIESFKLALTEFMTKIRDGTVGGAMPVNSSSVASASLAQHITS